MRSEPVASAPNASPVRPARWLLAWRIVFWLAVAALFAWGAWLRWKDGFVAVCTADSGVYLFGALRGDTAEVPWRTFVYPLFLKLVTEHGGTLATVLAWQKLGGLATAALVLTVWLRFKTVAHYGFIGRVLHDSLGLLILEMLLLPFASTRLFEQSIMLEAASAFMLALYLWVTAELFFASCRRARPGVIVTWVMVAVGVGLFAKVMNPRFSPLSLLSFGFAAIALYRSRATWKQWALAYLVPLLISIPVCVLPQRRLDQRNMWNRTFVPMHMFCYQAKLILPELRHDLFDSGFKRYDRTLVSDLAAQISALIEEGASGPNAHGGNFTLKYDPNRLIWGPAVDGMRRHFANDPDGFNEFCQHYLRRMLLHRPGEYALKAWTEWRYLFQPGNPLIDDSWEPQQLETHLAFSRGSVDYYLAVALPAARPFVLAYKEQLAQTPPADGGLMETPYPFNHIGNYFNRYFLQGWFLTTVILAAVFWWKRSDVVLIRFAVLFLGSSLLLVASLAPLALVTTSCGFRVVQALRMLFVLNFGAMVMTSVAALAACTPWRNLVAGPGPAPR